MIVIEMPTLPSTTPIVVASIFVKPGDVVEAGQELFTAEASKRSASVKAPASGTVLRILAVEGQAKAPKSAVVEIEEQIGGEAGARAASDSSEAAPTAEDSESTSCADAGTSARDAAADGEGFAELLVIGGGTGGYVAALYAAKMGMRVTLVERDRLGGTCLNRGCIPTKTLIASASLMRDIARAGEWGLEVRGGCTPHMDAIVERKDRVVGELVDGIEFLMEKNGVRVLRGQARFEDDRTVVVSAGREQRLSFGNCIIATGSAIRPLSVPGADLPQIMNTDDALERTELPESIVIVGGGVTGMEFAFMYRNLGSQVTVIARRPRLLHAFDETASQAILQSAREHGIRVELGGNVCEFSQNQDGAVTTLFAQGDELHSVESTHVLLAGGRTPQTQGLGLARTGVAQDERTGAILVDGCMHTNVERIYAIGDVNGLVMLAHAASYQGRIAVDDMLGRNASLRKSVIPSVAYTDPEVATVGVGVDEARANPQDYSIGSFSFAHNGKSLAENHADGYVSLVADAAGRVRGATMVGAQASALIGYAAVAISSGLSSDDLCAAVFAHPTTTEAIHEAACDLTFGALHE